MYKGDTLIGRSIRAFINLCYTRSNATNLIHKLNINKYQISISIEKLTKVLMWMRISTATRDRAKLRKQFY